jgi:pimeloyl-ACP methyl ester carboxylesterase
MVHGIDHHSEQGSLDGVAVRLVRLQARDGVGIDALRYGDEAHSVGVLHVHGKGSSFLTGPSRFLPPRWPGVTHLALNMRFRDLAFTDAEGSPWAAAGSVPAGGGYWERIADGPLDLEAGVDHLRAFGCDHIVIVGHSSGGFYTARYAAGDPAIAARVLIGPLTGNRTAFHRWFGSDEKRDLALDQARAMVEDGRGHELIPLSTWYYGVSATSLLERAGEADGIWLESMNANPSPTLLVWGGLEDRDALWRDLFEQFTVEKKELAVIKGAEHHFVRFEDELADTVRRFVDGLELA